MNERERLRIQRADAQSGSTINRVGRVRREGDNSTAPTQNPRRRRSAAGLLGPLFIVLAALAVLGVLVFVVFGRGDADLSARGGGSPSAEASPVPTRTPLRGLTGGTPAPTASATPTGAPTPSARPTPSTTPPPATAAPTPPPPPTPAPPPEFAASVQVCRNISNGSCVEELRTVNPSHGFVVLLAQVENANPGDVVGFEVSGPQGVADAGSVVLEGAGSGYAYVEFSTQDRPRGTYTVTVTRNGESAARTSFVRVGN